MDNENYDVAELNEEETTLAESVNDDNEDNGSSAFALAVIGVSAIAGALIVEAGKRVYRWGKTKVKSKQQKEEELTEEEGE